MLEVILLSFSLLMNMYNSQCVLNLRKTVCQLQLMLDKWESVDIKGIVNKILEDLVASKGRGLQTATS